jgi:ATP/maltotriose-dependent transcriptional regulator MalT
MRRTYLVFGLFIAGLLLASRALEGLFIAHMLSENGYAVALGVLFLAAGIWVGSRVLARTSPAETRDQAKAPLIETVAPTDELTPREAEVLQLLAEGLSNQQIADRLYVSLSTVKTHISNLYSKLGAERRTQALARARALGWLAQGVAVD